MGKNAIGGKKVQGSPSHGLFCLAHPTTGTYNANSGKNSNRTSTTQTVAGVTATTTYDNADRLSPGRECAPGRW
jgi:hypothetical protein